MTSGTSGHLLPGSSSSANLQSSLESRLRAKLSTLGSTLYTLTWKPWATPSGSSRFRLRASVRRTSETDCTGWPTPAARDWKGATLERWGTNARPLNEVARLAGWPTVTAADAHRGTKDSRPQDTGMPLNQAVALTRTDSPVRLTVHGRLLTGCCAGMPGGGQLNPAHSRWLMGLPPEWDDCAVTAMVSVPRQRKHS